MIAYDFCVVHSFGYLDCFSGTVLCSQNEEFKQTVLMLKMIETNITAKIDAKAIIVNDDTHVLFDMVYFCSYTCTQ